MPETNGPPQVNGFHKPSNLRAEDREESCGKEAAGMNGIPPVALHENGEYVKRITIPMKETPAWRPSKKLRVVTVGAGYSGMILAQKLQHKYAGEMDQIVEHVIYEARDSVGGTWGVNTYPGVMCDVPSAIYVRPPYIVQNLYRALILLRHSPLIQTRSGATSTPVVRKFWTTSSGR